MFMNLLKVVKNKIANRRFIDKISNKCIVEKNAVIESNCYFSGGNRVASNTYLNNVKMGFASYVGKNCRLENAIIGKYSCIGQRVILIKGEHPLEFVSMHPVFYSIKKQVGFTFVENQKFDEYKYVDKNLNNLIIGSDVWIASDVRLIEGITIGDGAAILPGAVVNKDVPPYAVVGGVPAKIIKYRFKEEIIDKLEHVKWWDRDMEWISENKDLFSDIDMFMKNI